MTATTAPRSARQLRTGAARRLVALAATTFLVAGIAACAGSASVGESTPISAPDMAPPAATAVPADQAGGGTKDGLGYVTSGEGGSGASGGQAVSPADATSIIKTGSLTLEVDEIETAVAAAKKAVADLGGYVSATAESNYTAEKTMAQITYRIPAARWDDALAAIKGLAKKVTDEQTSTLEITAQILDLDARLRNLQASETALLAIMEKATKVTDILEVQRQLTDVRGQIEQLTTEKRHLADQAAMSTLTVVFTVPVAAVTETQQGWDLSKTVDQAAAALVGLAQFGASAVIWAAIVLLPALLVLGVLFLLLRFVARPFRRFMPGRPAASAEAATEKADSKASK